MNHNTKFSGEKLPQSDEQIDQNDDEEPGISIQRSNTTIKLPNGTSMKGLSEEEITEKLENILLERVTNSAQGSRLAAFQLGQLYFEQKRYQEAIPFFQKAADKGDLQAKFQLGVIFYDGLADKTEHGTKERVAECKQGFELMLELANNTSKEGKHLVRAAQFNVGRAYFQGFGVKNSDEEAERYWLLAADDGNPLASVKAQSILGMFYSLKDTLDLDKAFFWHSEACGNGSLESQGALGVMYQNGLGCKKSMENAFICLRDASERGNVYAMGNLIAYYYKRKLYTKTVELAARVMQINNCAEVAEETDCVEEFIHKGVAMACFYYGRLLHHGLGIAQDKELSNTYYSMCYSHDPDVCCLLQNAVQHGAI